MNTLLSKRSALFLVLAIILSTAIVRTHSVSNVTACTQSPACTYPNSMPTGTLTTSQYGYPLHYREVVSFVPVNNNEHAPHYAGFASSSVETQGISKVDIVVNIIFWFALLTSLAMFIPLNRTAKSKKSRQ